MQFDPWIAVLVCSPLSLVGSVGIIGGYLFRRYVSGLPLDYLHFLFLVSLNDTGFAITSLIGPPSDALLCKIQAFFIVYFLLCSVCWTMALSYYILRAYVHDDDFIVENKAVPWWLYAFAQCLPAVVAGLPVNLYTVTGEWCWIPFEYPAWRFCTFYAVVWIGWLFVFYVSYRSRVQYRALGNEQQTPEVVTKRKRLSSMFYYPLVLILCYAAGTVNRIAESVNEEKFPVWGGIQTVMQCLQGVFNAGIFVFTQDIVAELLLAWPESLRFSGCCKSRPLTSTGSLLEGDGVSEVSVAQPTERDQKTGT